MRIAIITESFPPDVNGVAHCVVRVAEHLARKGHHPLVIAPESGRAALGADSQFPFPVERVPSVPLPGYPTFRLGLPTPKTRRAIAAHRTEVVHLASPVALGAWGTRVARAEHLPTVAVYQTDLPSYARAYHLGRATEAFAWRWLRDIHNAAGPHPRPVQRHRRRPGRPRPGAGLAVGPRRRHRAVPPRRCATSGCGPRSRRAAR